MTSGSTLEPVTPLTRRAPKVGRALVAAALALGGIAAAQAQARYALTELPLLPGAASCAPTRLNDRGDVVGYCAPAADVGQVVGSSHPPFGSRPVVWNNDAAHTPHALPTLDGDNNGRAFAINTLGHVLGASYDATPGTWDAKPERLVVWRDGGVFELQSLLDPVSGAGWTVRAASALNTVGQIVAVATHADATRAVLLTPID